MLPHFPTILRSGERLVSLCFLDISAFFCSQLATCQKTAKLFKLNTFQPSAPDGVDTGEGEEGGAGMVVVDKHKLDKNKLDKNKAADLNEQLKMSFARLRRY